MMKNYPYMPEIKDEPIHEFALFRSKEQVKDFIENLYTDEVVESAKREGKLGDRTNSKEVR
jgi:hypothetical protein